MTNYNFILQLQLPFNFSQCGYKLVFDVSGFLAMVDKCICTACCIMWCPPGVLQHRVWVSLDSQILVVMSSMLLQQVYVHVGLVFSPCSTRLTAIRDKEGELHSLAVHYVHCVRAHTLCTPTHKCLSAVHTCCAIMTALRNPHSSQYAVVNTWARCCVSDNTTWFQLVAWPMNIQ